MSLVCLLRQEGCDVKMTTQKPSSMLREASHQIIAGGSAGKRGKCVYNAWERLRDSVSAHAAKCKSASIKFESKLRRNYLSPLRDDGAKQEKSKLQPLFLNTWIIQMCLQMEIFATPKVIMFDEMVSLRNPEVVPGKVCAGAQGFCSVSTLNLQLYITIPVFIHKDV